MKLSLTVDSIYMVIWWVDAYYNTHKFQRSYQVCYIPSQDKSSEFLKKKINMRSSIESELVGADESVTTLMWGGYSKSLKVIQWIVIL